MEEKNKPAQPNDEQTIEKQPTSDTASKSENSIHSDEETKQAKLDPTRYGDWEMNGRCIDF